MILWKEKDIISTMDFEVTDVSETTEVLTGNKLYKIDFGNYSEVKGSTELKVINYLTLYTKSKMVPLPYRVGTKYKLTMYSDGKIDIS